MPRSKDGMLQKYGPLNHARRCYQNKKREAKTRNIEFKLTFQEYYEWFLIQGIDKNIPQKLNKHAWCMCRFNDTGPYELGNIYLDTMENNSRFGAFTQKYIKKIKIDHSHRCVKVITPDGVFESVRAAANYYDIDRSGLRYRIKNWEGYEYASP